MVSRAEITTSYAKAYVKASKKDRGRILDEVVSVTGWSRDNARRRFTAVASSRPPGRCRQVAKQTRKPRTPKYSYGTLKVLQRVWAASGGQCGRYLAASMSIQLDVHPAWWAGASWRAHLWCRPVQRGGTRRTVSDEFGIDRPLPEVGACDRTRTDLP